MRIGNRVKTGRPRPRPLAVPPRELAATITALGVLRAGWAVSGVYIFLGIASLAALWVARGYSLLACVPLAAAVAILAALLLLVSRPNSRRGAAFLAISTLANYAWVYGLLAVDPMLRVNGTYVINRMTIAMLLIGAVSSQLIHGVAWCTAGWLLGSASTVAAYVAHGQTEIHFGYGPFAALAIYVVIMVMFVVIRSYQRRFTAAFSSMEREPARITGQRELEERAIALLHDTVLSDLTAIVTAKSPLDERTVANFQRDIDAVENADIDTSASDAHAGDWLRRELLSTISEFQWRGLRVEVTGGGELSGHTSSAVASALVAAIRACLENVIRHSGSDSAEIYVDSSATELSVMIVDHGTGFVADAVQHDRLGLKSSIVQRVQAEGGRAKIWSAPGEGTSIILVVPLLPAEESVVHE